MAKTTSFRYPNNLNTHKKKADVIKATKTAAAVRDAHDMRNKQSAINDNVNENHYNRKKEVPVL